MVMLTECKLELFNSGKGGQGQNKRPCNVRLTHLLSGITVTVRGRSKQRNVNTALRELTKRIADAETAEKQAKQQARWREKIKDRRVIRTYDLTAGRVKDHRTGRKAEIRRVLAGDLDGFVG